MFVVNQSVVSTVLRLQKSLLQKSFWGTEPCRRAALPWRPRRLSGLLPASCGRLALVGVAVSGLAAPVAPVRAEESTLPYVGIVVMAGLGKCYHQQGIIPFERYVYGMMELAKKRFGMERDQVITLMQGPTFKADMETYIQSEGGCRALADEYKSKTK
jgi:hypothetical protein